MRIFEAIIHLGKFTLQGDTLAELKICIKKGAKYIKNVENLVSEIATEIDKYTIFKIHS